MTPSTEPPNGQTPSTEPPAGQTPSTEPPTGQTPSTEPPAGQTPSAEPPTGQTPSTEPPTGQTPSAEPPTGQTPSTEPPTGQTLSAEPPTGQTPSTEPPTGQTPSTEPPVGQTPSTEPPIGQTPSTEPPTGQTPSAEPPAGQTPSAEPPTGQTPSTEPPNGQTPSTEPPTGQTPSAEPPNGQTPSTEPPDGQTPSTEPPTGQTPSAEPPDGQTPSTEPPDGQTPSTEPPTGQTPSTEPPTGQTPSAEPPDGQTPSTEPPDGQTPSTEPPTGQTPSTEPPTGQTPSTEPPNASSAGPQSVLDCEENQCLAREDENPERLDLYGCFCDNYCFMFGDCCRDAPGAAAAYEETTCVTQFSDFFSDGYYVGLPIYIVSQCPASWTHAATRQACETKNASLYDDPLAAMPMTSTRSNQTYRNAACARCHEDTTGVEFWRATVKCPEVPMSDRNNVTAETLQRNKDGDLGVTTFEDGVAKFWPCYRSIFLEIPRHVRVCVPTVSDCAPDWTDHETAAECAAYTARVTDLSERNTRAEEYRHMYRNPHCALCNGVPLDQLSCQSSVGFVASPDWSLSVLLDFNDRSGSDTVGKVIKCKGTRRWDRLLQKCRDVFCDADHVLEDDGCVPETDTSSDSAEPSRFRLCPKFYLSPDEFETRPDGSVYVQLYDRVYVDGEFELRDGELAVCSLSSDLGKFDDTLGILSLVFLAASVICLCCHLLSFCLVSERRNLPGKNLATLCVCLLLGYICFLAAPSQEAGTAGCRAIGIVMYAAFIASFLWMNVMAFDVFRSLRYVCSDYIAFCLQLKKIVRFFKISFSSRYAKFILKKHTYVILLII